MRAAGKERGPARMRRAAIVLEGLTLGIRKTAIITLHHAIIGLARGATGRRTTAEGEGPAARTATGGAGTNGATAISLPDVSLPRRAGLPRLPAARVEAVGPHLVHPQIGTTVLAKLTINTAVAPLPSIVTCIPTSKSANSTAALPWPQSLRQALAKSKPSASGTASNGSLGRPPRSRQPTSLPQTSARALLRMPLRL